MSSLLATIPPPPLRGEDGMTTFDLGPLSVAAYGILIAVGAYVGLVLAVRRYREMGGDPELAERMALLGLGAAIVGARIGYLIPRLDHFLANPLEIPAIWQGGLAFFGGVTLAVPVAWWYVHHRGGGVAAMADAVAPALPLGHAIGRWGNYFNQELYGRPTDLPWALEVEAHRRVSGYTQFETFHPTFLYESLWNLLLVVVLLWIGRRRVGGEGGLRRGSLGFLYLVGYGAGRFANEFLRIDTLERYAGLSRNAWVALLIVLVGVLGLLWWQRRGRSSGSAEADPDPDDVVDARHAGDGSEDPPGPARE